MVQHFSLAGAGKRPAKLFKTRLHSLVKISNYIKPFLAHLQNCLVLFSSVLLVGLLFLKIDQFWQKHKFVSKSWIHQYCSSSLGWIFRQQLSLIQTTKKFPEGILTTMVITNKSKMQGFSGTENRSMFLENVSDLTYSTLWCMLFFRLTCKPADNADQPVPVWTHCFPSSKKPSTRKKGYSLENHH